MFSAEDFNLKGLIWCLENDELGLRDIKHRFDVKIAIEVPPGHVGLICDRSGLGAKGVKVFGGVLDSGYRGEIGIVLMNFGSENLPIRSGDKIAQILILPINEDIMQVVEELSESDRGSRGFGSSGR